MLSISSKGKWIASPEMIGFAVVAWFGAFALLGVMFS